MRIKRVVADAGLLLPEAGTVDLDKFQVDLWLAHSEEERLRVSDRGGQFVDSEH